MGGSIPMNIAWISSRGMTAADTAVMPHAAEYVCQSRVTARISSGVVTDQ